jgi:8-oxo-dGTP diphosphatase
MITVTAAILIENGQILIAKRKANDKLGNKWEFPGGKVETGETPEQSLKREIQEEFEIGITIGDYLGESTYHYDHGSIRLLAYRVYWKDGDLMPRDHSEFRWVSVNQLKDFEFAPADLPFVDKLRSGEIGL